jgi:hypothetical protein
MKTQRLLIALTVVNVLLLIVSLVRLSPAGAAQGIAPVLRGHALEIVDDRGEVRASITLVPADRAFKMPDGTIGYPETTLFRLIDPNGRPNVKIHASEEGGGVGLGGASDPTYASIGAKGATTSLKLTNEDGRQQVVTPQDWQNLAVTPGASAPTTGQR